MKIEKRGKYPGAKVHLDPEECEALMAFSKDVEMMKNQHKPEVNPTNMAQTSYFTISARIGKKLTKIITEEPDFLKERTPEQVKESLLRDKEKIEKQLAAGAGWKQVD